MRVVRFAVLSSLAAAAASLCLLGAPGKSLAGDDDGYSGWSDDGWYTDVHRDGNVFYNAYNSYDGYDRHRYGDYWQRPNDGYGEGYQGGYGGEGYSAGYGYYGEGYRYGRDGRVYYPNYGHVDVTHRQIRRTERRIHCEANGGREYHGRCY